MNIFERLWFKARTGETIKDLGSVEEVVIRYKEYYISLLIGEDEIKSLGWADNPMMFNVPVRNFWLATPPQSATPEEGKDDVVAKINRLIVQSQIDILNDWDKFFESMSSKDGTTYIDLHSWVANITKKLSNNLSKGDGDEN